MNHRLEFRTWQAFIEATRGTSAMKDDHRASKTNSRSFYGCTPVEAQQMADIGWLSGAEKARAMSEGITAALGSLIERHDIVYDVEGAILDIGRYTSHEPECWAKFETMMVESISPKFVRVVVNIAGSAGVSADVFIGRGAVIAALVDLLSFSGCSVELVVADVAKHKENFHTTLVTIKRFEEPLDLPMVAYAMGHPSTHRVHWFSLMETQSRDVRDAFNICLGGGYSSPTTLDASEHGDIYVDRMLYGESQWTDPEDASDWVRAKLKEFGVTFKDEKTA